MKILVISFFVQMGKSYLHYMPGRAACLQLYTQKGKCINAHLFCCYQYILYLCQFTNTEVL